MTSEPWDRRRSQASRDIFIGEVAAKRRSSEGAVDAEQWNRTNAAEKRAGVRTEDDLRAMWR